MSIVLVGESGFPGEDSHELFPHEGGTWSAGQLWAAMAMVVVVVGLLAVRDDDRTRRCLEDRLEDRGPGTGRGAGGRHRRRSRGAVSVLNRVVGSKGGMVGAVALSILVGVHLCQRVRHCGTALE